VSRKTSPGFLWPLLAVVAGAGVVTALGFIWFYAPEEQVLGVSQKIFYFHVPSAFGMYFATGLCALSSAVFLVTRKDKADALAAASGSVALVFCIVVLVTGPLWARAAWGVWWTWEPRLTSVMVLGLVLFAYAVLRKAAERTPGLARFAAALAVLGAVDIPIIHLAVRKWRGNHPTVIYKSGGLTPEMGLTFGISLAAFTVLVVVLLALRYRIEVSRREVARLTAAQALRPDGAATGG